MKAFLRVFSLSFSCYLFPLCFWYKSVHVKEEKLQMFKSLITARETVKHKELSLKCYSLSDYI